MPGFDPDPVALDYHREGRLPPRAAKQITEQNAALVEESTAAARNLSVAAATLSELVSRFDYERQTGGLPEAAARRELAT